MRRVAPLLLLILATVAHSQDAPAADPFEGVATRLTTLVPHVETACGAKFATPPEVEVLSLDAAIPIFATDMRYEIAMKYVQVPERARERLLATKARGAVLSCVARYSISRKRILLVRQGFDRQADALEVPPEERAAFLDAVLAHELVHALDDARFDLGRLFGGATDLESLHARAMLVEGRAVVLGRKAGHAAKLPARHVDRLPGGKEPKTVGAFRARFTYEAGAAFFENHLRRGGRKAADALLARPPATTHAVFHPDVKDPAAGFERARGALKDAGVETPAELSELALRSRYASRLGRTKASELFAEFRGGAQALVDGVNVSALVFAGEEPAAAFAAASGKETATERRERLVFRAAGPGAEACLKRILDTLDD